MKKRLISLLLAVLICASLLAFPAGAVSEGGAVTTTALNLRSNPNTSADIILTMPKGAQVIVISSSNGWSRINYNGTVAYASSQYLSLKSSVTGSFGSGEVTGNYVRLRSGAGSSYSVVSSFDKGTQLKVTGASGNWYAVTVNGKSGYMSADYIKFTESGTSNPAPSSPSVSPESTGYPAQIIGTSVRLRKGPGTSYDTVCYCSKGASATVYSSENGWYKLSCNGKTGYMSGKYVRITPEESFDTEKAASIKVDGVNLRMGPSTDAFSSVKKLGPTDKITVSGKFGNWYQVSADGSYGYVYCDFVSLSSSQSGIPKVDTIDNKVGTVSGNGVRLRSGPGTGYSIVGYYNKGVQFTVTGKSGDWYQLKSGSTVGFMSSRYISLSTQSSLADQIAKTALQYLDVPYVYGGTSPRGFDCSGFCYYVYQQYGYKLYRTAQTMWDNNGVYVEKQNLQPGDLVFFKSSSSSTVSHVGMYIGDGKFVHAATGKGKVVITELSDSGYYYRNYVGAKRIIGT